MKIKLISVVLAVIILGVWHSPAEATRSFTIVQIPSPVELVMGTTNNQMTFRVTNNSTAGETITAVRFNINNTYTALPNPETFVAPTGWTCTRSSGTRITCTASSSTYYITPGTNKDFKFNINSIASNTDRTDQLASAQARFSGSNTWRTPNTTTSSWTWKALSMTLVPSTFNVGKGCQFTLTMTITNKSTSNLTGITSVAKPPTPAGVSVSTVSNPANLSLNAGATGTMVWTYTTGSTAGTVTFTACASTGAGCTTTSGTTRTSSTITTSTITVTTSSCTLTATIAVTPTCLFTGDPATFIMTVNNTTGSTVNNVLPSALTPILSGAAVIGAFSPASQSPISINNNSSGTFTWTATVTGNVNDTYAVSGNAMANGPITTATATSNTEDVDGYIVAVNPDIVNAGSTAQELTWTIANDGCADVKQVQITIPVLPSAWGSVTDTYSLIEQFNPPNPGTNPIDPIDNVWTVSGTNPVIFAATILPPSGSTNVLPLIAGSDKDGSFSLVFPTTPSSTGTGSFQITITDTNNRSIILSTDVTVNSFNSGAPNPNANDTNTIREDIR